MLRFGGGGSGGDGSGGDGGGDDNDGVIICDSYKIFFTLVLVYQTDDYVVIHKLDYINRLFIIFAIS